MRRLAVLSLVILLVVTAGVAPATLTLSSPVEAQSQPTPMADWRQYDADEELEIDDSDGLNDEELDAVVSRTMVRVEETRGIEFEERPSVRLITREEFQTELPDRGGNPSHEAVAFQNGKYQALFLVGDDENALDAREKNLGTAVGAFYSPANEEIVVVSDSDPARLNELTLAHELVHAYQDQRWGLANYDEETSDGRNAQLGLIEGEAVYVENLYEDRCEADWECMMPPDAGSDESTPSSQPANVGVLLLDFQPYDSGPTFVETAHRSGGWDAVDALHDAPPETAEQVIVPDAYPEDDPREVRIEDTNSGDWERVEPGDAPNNDQLGMGAITTMFVNPLYDSGGQEWVVPADEWFTSQNDPPEYGMFNYDSEYATGWDGDRLHIYENGDELGYVWKLAWDTPADAETFVSGFDELLAYWSAERVESDTYVVEEGGYDGAYHVAVEGDTVTITYAPDIESLTAVSEAAQPGTDASAPETATDDDREGPIDIRVLLEFGVVATTLALVLGAYLLVRRR
ncbi:MAG: Hvo_1808 family surface protein [Halalkalicoccus sp.]|nr:Hvo_1808 family surface protein [Halalkalicoccus sp.]